MAVVHTGSWVDRLVHSRTSYCSYTRVSAVASRHSVCVADRQSNTNQHVDVEHSRLAPGVQLNMAKQEGH